MSNKGGLIFLGCLGAAAILLPFVLRRRYEPIQEAASYQLVPVRRQSSPQLNPATYENEETWDLQYTEDGLIKKVIVHRKAVQT